MSSLPPYRVVVFYYIVGIVVFLLLWGMTRKQPEKSDLDHLPPPDQVSVSKSEDDFEEMQWKNDWQEDNFNNRKAVVKDRMDLRNRMR